MRDSEHVVEAIKSILRETGKTYGTLAKELELSESNVKRMFSKKAFSLKMLDRIAAAQGVTLFEIIERAKVNLSSEWHQFTEDQESMLLKDPRLTGFSLLVISRKPLPQIRRRFRLSDRDTERFLLKLDRMGIIDLREKNHYTVKVPPRVRPIPGGPIEKYGFSALTGPFLAGKFNRESDYSRLLFSKLTKEVALRLKEKFRKLAAEMFEESVSKDVFQETAKTYGLIIAFGETEFSLLDILQGRSKG